LSAQDKICPWWQRGKRKICAVGIVDTNAKLKLTQFKQTNDFVLYRQRSKR